MSELEEIEAINKAIKANSHESEEDPEVAELEAINQAARNFRNEHGKAQIQQDAKRKTSFASLAAAFIGCTILSVTATVMAHDMLIDSRVAWTVALLATSFLCYKAGKFVGEHNG